MNCVNEVEALVIKAQKEIIDRKSSYDFWDDPITNAITQCFQLGTDRYRNDLLLKVRDYLAKVGLEGREPKVLSLGEFETRPVPHYVKKDNRLP